MQTLLKNGRFSVLLDSRPPRQVSVDSELDPDLYVWETVYFGLVDKSTMGSLLLCGLVRDTGGWRRRMADRGFPDPRTASRYPPYVQQKRAEKRWLAQQWGAAAEQRDKLFWTGARDVKPEGSPLSCRAKGRRSLIKNKQATGTAASQTRDREFRPSSQQQQPRTRDGKFKNLGKVTKKRLEQVRKSRARTVAKTKAARKAPLELLEKALLHSQTLLTKAKMVLKKPSSAK